MTLHATHARNRPCYALVHGGLDVAWLKPHVGTKAVERGRRLERHEVRKHTHTSNSPLHPSASIFHLVCEFEHVVFSRLGTHCRYLLVLASGSLTLNSSPDVTFVVRFALPGSQAKMVRRRAMTRNSLRLLTANSIICYQFQVRRLA